MSKLKSWTKIASMLVVTSMFVVVLPSRTAEAQATTLTINAAADAYVMESVSSTNYGTETSLYLDKNPATNSFLKFNVSGVGAGTVTRAVLRIYANSDNPKGYDVYAVSNSSWDETSINFSNAPAFGSALKASGSVSAGGWNEIDITGSIKGDGSYSLGLASSYGRKTDLAARENSSHAPQLVLTVTTPEPTATATIKPTSPAPTRTALPTTTPTLRPTTSPTTPSQPFSSPTVRPTTSPTGSPNPLLTATAKPSSSPTLLPSPTATPAIQLLPPLTTPQTYYVSTNGSDINPGTFNQPWRTIQKAADTAVAGDRVLLRGGTYHERVLLNKNSGAENNRISFEAYPGEVPVIDGTGIVLAWKGLFEINGVGYIRVSGLRVTNSDDFGIFVNRSHHVDVLNNSTEYTHASGIGIWNSDSILVDHNVVLNARYVTLAMGGHEESISIANTTHFEVSHNDVSLNGVTGYLGNEAIDCKDGSRFGSVHHNYAHGFQPQGGAIYADAWDSLTGNIDIYSNRISGGGMAFNSERGGILENINVYNNTIYGVSWSGIVLSNTGNGNGGNGLRRNLNLYNNTIYKTLGNGGAGIYIVSENIENIGIYNNIVYFNLHNGEITAAVPAILSKISAHNNLVFGPKLCSLDYPSCIEISSNPAGYPNIAGNMTADPRFVDLIVPNLHVQSLSPAIGAGYDLGLQFDLDGIARPQGMTYDIGAYEFR